METYLVLRRSGWISAEGLRAAIERSLEESERTLDDIGLVRGYVLDERDGTIGAACVFEARSPEAIRRHSEAAGLPVDEIIKVADTEVVRPTPASLAKRE